MKPEVELKDGRVTKVDRDMCALSRNVQNILIVSGEHSQFKKAMKDYICDNDKNKPMIL